MSTPLSADSFDSMDDPLFPTETEIYLLPSGDVIVADLPAELDAAISTLGERLPDEREAFLVTDDAAGAPSDALPPPHRSERVATVAEAKKQEMRAEP